MKNVIGIVGFIGSGKDTIADHLVKNFEFVRDSFAAPLKDAAAAVFGWNRLMLEGTTAESREWRNQVDTWWAERLQIPNLTPRWVLQHWGTEVLRESFHDDIWIASLEHRLASANHNTVISDVRFPNEMLAIKRAQGTLIRVVRGSEPDWYELAVISNTSTNLDDVANANRELELKKIHASERSWIGLPIDYVITNNGTLEELQDKINNLVLNLPAST